MVETLRNNCVLFPLYGIWLEVDGAGTEGTDAAIGNGISPTLDWDSDYDSGGKCDLMSVKLCFSAFGPPFCTSRYGYLIRVTL